jgi:sec-independent protein translocase protein TatA
LNGGAIKNSPLFVLITNGNRLLYTIIALVIFGPGKLPELGKGLGKSIREFKKALSDDEKNSFIEVKKDTLQDTSEKKV